VFRATRAFPADVRGPVLKRAFRRLASIRRVPPFCLIIACDALLEFGILNLGNGLAQSSGRRLAVAIDLAKCRVGAIPPA
jgi:hypothetical protein